MLNDYFGTDYTLDTRADQMLREAPQEQQRMRMARLQSGGPGDPTSPRRTFRGSRGGVLGALLAGGAHGSSGGRRRKHKRKKHKSKGKHKRRGGGAGEEGVGGGRQRRRSVAELLMGDAMATDDDDTGFSPGSSEESGECVVVVGGQVRGSGFGYCGCTGGHVWGSNALQQHVESPSVRLAGAHWGGPACS